MEYCSDWYQSNRSSEYLVSRFHACLINDCIFEKDHLIVVNTRDAVFTETASSLQNLFPNVSFTNTHLHFVTDIGPSFNLSKLVRFAQDNKWLAFTLFTLFGSIHGHLEHIAAHRPRTHNSKDAWEDERKEDARYELFDPDILIG